jgi:hypothetical protein
MAPGLLADAGRRRLTTLVPGSDQERALRQAATAAGRTGTRSRPWLMKLPAHWTACPPEDPTHVGNVVTVHVAENT